MQTRRDFGKMALAGLLLAPMKGFSLVAAPPLEWTIAGVKVGLITGSLGGVGGVGRGTGTGATEATLPPGKDPVDAVIEACLEVGVANIEWGGPGGGPTVVDGIFGQVPPSITPAYANSRDAVRQWRLTAPLEPFREARKKFDASGLNWFSGNTTISDDCTDAEIDALFKQMQAMGVDRFCTNQTRVSQGPRLAAFAEKYNISPAWHTHDASEDPNEVSSPESLIKLMGTSPKFWILLDIGHYVAGNNDPVAFIKEHHGRISHLHLKDRKRNHGPNVPWGTGDTPIAECLRLIRDNHYNISCIIEREYHGPNDGTPVEETKKCVDFITKALET